MNVTSRRSQGLAASQRPKSRLRSQQGVLRFGLACITTTLLLTSSLFAQAPQSKTANVAGAQSFRKPAHVALQHKLARPFQQLHGKLRQGNGATACSSGGCAAQTGLIYGTEAVSQQNYAGGVSQYFGSNCGPQISVKNRAAMCPRCGVDEACKCCSENGDWKEKKTMHFDQYGQGEYIGPHRPHHVTRYRLRVDDQVSLVYRLTRELNPNEYQFNVGDSMLIEGETLTGGDSGNNQASSGFSRNLVILPDGSITLPLIGQVRAAGRTVQQLREEIQEKSKKWYKFALWTVTPVQVNTRLEDLRNAVDARQGSGGQSIDLVVSPDGTIQPPALGPVCVQGLTLDEAKFEIDQRYAQSGFRGIEVTPILVQRAPTFVYVLGEVNQPGRYDLVRPTTAMGAIALAGGWDTGGDLRQIVIFRRADDWRLVATKLNLAGALYGNHPTPADEIFLRDSDIVLIPKRPIQRVDDIIDLIFTQGLNPMISFGAALDVLELNFVN